MTPVVAMTCLKPASFMTQRLKSKTLNMELLLAPLMVPCVAVSEGALVFPSLRSKLAQLS